MTAFTAFLLTVVLLWLGLAIWRLRGTASRQSLILFLTIALALNLGAWRWVSTARSSLHDTYYVIAPVSYIATLAALYLGGWALWWLIHKTAPGYWPRLGQVVFWLMHVGVGLTLLPLVSLGTLPVMLSAYLAPVGRTLSVAAVAFTLAALAIAAWVRLSGRR